MYYISIGLSIFALVLINRHYGKGEPFRAQDYEMSSVPQPASTDNEDKL
jgi:hypothetical protein